MPLRSWNNHSCRRRDRHGLELAIGRVALGARLSFLTPLRWIGLAAVALLVGVALLTLLPFEERGTSCGSAIALRKAERGGASYFEARNLENFCKPVAKQKLQTAATVGVVGGVGLAFAAAIVAPRRLDPKSNPSRE